MEVGEVGRDLAEAGARGDALMAAGAAEAVVDALVEGEEHDMLQECGILAISNLVSTAIDRDARAEALMAAGAARAVVRALRLQAGDGIWRKMGMVRWRSWRETARPGGRR